MNIHIEVHLNERERVCVTLKGYLNQVGMELGRRFRKAVIVCPGGSYAALSKTTEGEYVAVKYQASGCQAFVLEYSVKPAVFPQALLELAAAVKYIRMHADVLDVDPDKIFVCGFSAGGHLAASLGVFWNSEVLRPFYPNADLIRPTGMILCYPVITSGVYTHQETINNIMGNAQNGKELLSLENFVSQDTPPVFLWHTLEDAEVLTENTLLFVRALRQKKCFFELHIFPRGPHGLSLATEYTAVSEDHISEAVSKWFELSVLWLSSVCRKSEV